MPVIYSHNLSSFLDFLKRFLHRTSLFSPSRIEKTYGNKCCFKTEPLSPALRCSFFLYDVYLHYFLGGIGKQLKSETL